jgi:Cdc6-like AAA superfamily ATPase
MRAELKERIKKAFEKRVELRVKSRLAQNRLKVEDFTKEELDIIYEDERLRLKDELKGKALIALLAALGISLF